MMRSWKAQQARERLLVGAAYRDNDLIFCRASHHLADLPACGERNAGGRGRKGRLPDLWGFRLKIASGQPSHANAQTR
jgi:hypothetical protein